MQSHFKYKLKKMKKVTYKNRYNNDYIFTLDSDGNILWEGDFTYCRYGCPNDYTKAYKQWLSDFPETEILPLEDFKSILHKYDDPHSCYVYDKYIRLVESLTNKIHMVDPQGGPYIASGFSMNLISNEFKGMVVKEFKPIPTGYKIIIEK